MALTTKDTENTKSLDMSRFLFVTFVIFVVPIIVVRTQSPTKAVCKTSERRPIELSVSRETLGALWVKNSQGFHGFLL